MNGHSETEYKVILDTSILIYSVNLKLDLVTEIKELLEGTQELIIPSAVLNELGRVASYSGKRGIEARIALEIVEELLKKRVLNILNLDTKMSKLNDVDKLLIHLCKQLNAYLATADLKLKKEAVKRGVKVIYPRKSKMKLMID